MQSTRCSLQISLRLEFHRNIFEKYSNVKFHENPSSRSRVVACRRRDGWAEGQMDMTKLMVAIRSFANAPKIPAYCKYHNEHIKALY